MELADIKGGSKPLTRKLPQEKNFLFTYLIA